jgi:hypothetical protein
MSTNCPVCGYDLEFKPWDGDSPSDEICPSCGIQFGYHDAGPDGEITRAETYEEWRAAWIASGMVWHQGWSDPPPGWDPRQQLKLIGIDVAEVVEDGGT